MSFRQTKRALALVLALAASGCGGAPAGPLTFEWPPTVGQAYPDLELLNHHGETVRLSSFAGKVLLVEPIGMT